MLARAAPDVILIKGGTVVNADHQFLADVLLIGDTISAVGPGLSAPRGARVLDATGKLVMPGGAFAVMLPRRTAREARARLGSAFLLHAVYRHRDAFPLDIPSWRRGLGRARHLRGCLYGACFCGLWRNDHGV